MMKTSRGMSVLLLLAVCAALQWTHVQAFKTHFGACPQLPALVEIARVSLISTVKCRDDLAYAYVEKWCELPESLTKCVNTSIGKCPANPPPCFAPGLIFCVVDSDCAAGQLCCRVDCDDKCFDPVTGRVADPQPPIKNNPGA